MKRRTRIFSKEDYFLDEVKFPRSSGIEIKNIGYSHTDADYNWVDRRDYYILHYIENGKGEYRMNGSRYALGRGDGFVYFPDTLVSYTTDSENPWTCYWIGFYGSAADEAMESIGIRADHPIFQYHEDDRLTKEFFELFDMAKTHMVIPELYIGGFYTVVGIIASQARQSDAANTKLQPYFYLTRYISNNISYPISVRELAESQHMSESQVYRIFMKNAGMSPHEYIEKAKIGRACDYIKTSNMSFADLARSLGYTYESHFYKVFRKVTGMTPSEYKNARNI